MVGGKRVKTVDVHSHCLFHEALNLLGNEARSVLPPTKGVEEHFIVLDDRLKAMDAMGIDMGVLSINPFWYRKERDLAADIVRVQNEKLAELTASRPDRFAAFASLSLQFPELAVEQLERAIKQQGLKGAAIGGSVAGEDFSSPRFHPVWAKAEELGAVLFIHPQSTPELAPRFKGNGWLSNTIGNPLDLRGHARPLPGLEDHRRARRRISSVLRGAAGPCLLRLTAELRRRDQACQSTVRVSQATPL